MYNTGKKFEHFWKGIFGGQKASSEKFCVKNRICPPPPHPAGRTGRWHLGRKTPSTDQNGANMGTRGFHFSHSVKA